MELPTLKRHQDRIRAGLSDIEQRLAQHDEQHVGGRAFLHDSLRLLTDAHRAYARSDDGSKRLANQAFYTRLEITDDEQLRPRLAEPFATIVHEAAGGEEAKREHSTSTDVACSRKTLWVDQGGIEPPSCTVRHAGLQCNRHHFRPEVPRTGLEPARPKAPHFECGVSTSSTIGADGPGEGGNTRPKYSVVREGCNSGPAPSRMRLCLIAD